MSSPGGQAYPLAVRPNPDVTGARSDGRAARRLIGLGTLAAVPAAMAGASDWAETYGPSSR